MVTWQEAIFSLHCSTAMTDYELSHLSTLVKNTDILPYDKALIWWTGMLANVCQSLIMPLAMLVFSQSYGIKNLKPRLGPFPKLWFPYLLHSYMLSQSVLRTMLLSYLANALLSWVLRKYSAIIFFVQLYKCFLIENVLFFNDNNLFINSQIISKRL